MSDERLWINLTQIKLWNDNPNEGDVGAIIASIKQFGYRDTISLWKNNITKDGNHRVRALNWLRAEKWLPDQKSTCLKVVKNDWFITYEDITDLSPIESNAFALAKNRTVRLGYDDPLSLKKILKEIRLQSEASVFAATGFDLDDLGDLIKQTEFHDINPMEGLHDIYYRLPDEIFKKLQVLLKKYDGSTDEERFCAFIASLSLGNT